MSKSLKRNAFDFVTRMLVKAVTVLRKKERKKHHSKMGLDL